MEVTRVTQKLRQNPFEVDRDPRTGKWIVIKNPKLMSDRNFNNPKPLSNPSKSIETGGTQELYPDGGEEPLKE